MQVKIVNRCTGEQKVLSYESFKSELKIEFYRALQNYIRHETQKTSSLPKFMQKNISEADFLLSLAWNFNTYSGSDWYIAKIN